MRGRSSRQTTMERSTSPSSASARSPRKCLSCTQFGRDERVRQDPVSLHHGLARHLGVARDVRVVQKLSVRRGGSLQQAGKAGKVARHPLGRDLRVR